MTRTQRAVLLGLAVAVTLVAIFVLSRGNEEESTSTQSTPAKTEPARTETAKKSTKPAPELGPLLTAGSVKEITVKKGEQVRFRVRSSEPDEVHIHGYDIKHDLTPGKTADISFPATIDGIFEIELEQAGQQIAKLRVNP